MSDKEVDYSRMITGLSAGIAAIDKHEQGLRAFRAKLLLIVEEIDMVLAEAWSKQAREWYAQIRSEHDALIRTAALNGKSTEEKP